jgi:succinoglycan biosynthesis protein ExoA
VSAGHRLLIVVPCLNEASHIGPLMAQLSMAAARLDGIVVVVDGGSADRTVEIVVERAARDPLIKLMHNPRRIQSAALNLAVSRFGQGAEFLIRVDAHGGYPDDFCDRLIEEAEAVSADSVVVPMLTSGVGLVQGAIAEVQNSKLGTGGSKHRAGSTGEWVDHGHHALMRIAAFEAIGGYDETFSHNEDAELDFRLRQAGYRIWLSGRTRMTYYPRASLGALFRQYQNYGRGRARNVVKHRVVPKLRQLVPLSVFPAACLLPFAALHWIAAVPSILWAAACLGGGVMMAIRAGRPGLLLAGVSAMVMHFAWSFGFWRQLASSLPQLVRSGAAPAVQRGSA